MTGSAREPRFRLRPRLASRGVPSVAPPRAEPDEPPGAALGEPPGAAVGGPPRVALAGPPRVAGSLLRLSLAIAIGYAGLAGGLAYWQVIEAQSLTTDPLNPIVIAAARDAPRGTIYDSGGAVLARNVPGNSPPARVSLPRCGARGRLPQHDIWQCRP